MFHLPFTAPGCKEYDYIVSQGLFQPDFLEHPCPGVMSLLLASSGNLTWLRLL